MITGRIRIPVTKVRPSVDEALAEEEEELPLWKLFETRLVEISQILVPKLITDPSLLHALSPDQFEEFICERLFAMGMEAQRVGRINARDGGVDLVFWPRRTASFPFLGGAQIKHHRDPSRREGPSTVRDFAGVLAGHAFNAGLLVTNTSFTPDAKWFARERAKLLRLREFTDLKRWVVSSFSDESEWREIPEKIELCPGVVVDLRISRSFTRGNRSQ